MINLQLLLLDLDGVVVYEGGPPLLDGVEILRLHERIADRLASLSIPVVVLTHRSRTEAARILQAVGLPTGSLAGVMTAEDLAKAAVRHGRFRTLLTQGLRKSLILPVVEKRFGVRREAMALIDDRVENLEDLIAAGIALAIHAPSHESAEGRLVSFNLDEAIEVIRLWKSDLVAKRYVCLSPQELPLDASRRTGLCTTRQGRHAFNVLRTTVRRLRQSIQRRVSGADAN